jgi:hypothetical protein
MKNYCNSVIVLHCVYILVQLLAVRGLVAFSSIGVLFLASSQVLLLFYVFQNQSVQFGLNRYGGKIIIGYTLVFSLMLTLGVASGGIAYGGGGLVYDIAVMVNVYTAMILASCPRENMVVFLERVTIIEILSCLPHFFESGFALSAETQNLAREKIFEQRGNIDLALQSVAFFPASISNVVAYTTKRRSVMLAMILFSMNIVIGLQTSKRANILDGFICVIAIFIVLIIFKGKTKRKVFFYFSLSLVLAFLGVVIIYLYGFYLNAIIDRFTAANDDVLAIDRVEEGGKYLLNASFRDILFGKGLGSVTDAGGTENIHIHIGLINVIFKGGIVYLVWIAYLSIHSFLAVVLKNKGRLNDCIFSVSLIIVMVISMFHSPMWNVGFSQLQIWLAFFVLIINPQSQGYKQIWNANCSKFYK